MASGSHNKPGGEEKQYSTSELMASAKVVAEAAQATARNESNKVDKEKAADAAGDLLDAVGQYAKLDDQKGVGQYVDKAADSLHQYKPNTAADQSKGEDHHDAADPKSTGGSGGGGLGGSFTKLAGGFLK